MLAAPEAPDDQLFAALQRAQLLDTIKTMPDGLDTVIGDRGYRLSGGERQRLALARVLLTDPDILIMDEATAHLDVKTERAVTATLDQLNAYTIRLVIAHRLSTIRSADPIIVMDRWRPAQSRPVQPRWLVSSEVGPMPGIAHAARRAIPGNRPHWPGPGAGAATLRSRSASRPEVSLGSSPVVARKQLARAAECWLPCLTMVQPPDDGQSLMAVLSEFGLEAGDG